MARREVEWCAAAASTWAELEGTHPAAQPRTAGVLLRRYLVDREREREREMKREREREMSCRR